MGFMNEFLEHHWSTMTAFLRSVASPESSGHVATYDGYVDLALELATLHLLLCDIFSSLNQVPPPCPQGWLETWASFFSLCSGLGARSPMDVTAPLPPHGPTMSHFVPSGHTGRAGTSTHHPQCHQGGNTGPCLRPAQLHHRAKVTKGNKGHTGSMGTCEAGGVTPGAVWGGSGPGWLHGDSRI